MLVITRRVEKMLDYSVEMLYNYLNLLGGEELLKPTLFCSFFGFVVVSAICRNFCGNRRLKWKRLFG